MTPGPRLTPIRQALDSIDPALGAFITVDEDAALRQAREAAEGRLHGLTVAVKDLIEVAGLRTTYGSARYIDHVSEHTAPVVSSLVEQGAVVVGKTNLNEFAFGVSGFNPTFGPILCPDDRTRTAGGSSGGSAVAVAAGNCDLALGTDTSGSVRIPAACLGVWGFKLAPHVPLAGIWPLAPSFDSLGYLAREPGVIEHVMGFDLDGAAPAASIRVGYAGHDLQLPPLPPEHWVRFRHEAWAVHRAAFESDPDSYGKDLQVKLGRVRGDLGMAEPVMAEWRGHYRSLRNRFDVIVDTVFDGPAPLLESVLRDYAQDTFIESDRLLEKTPIANALGWPALVFPTSAGPRQVMGPPGTEPALFSVARRLSRG
ncbi:MAG: Amidase [Blastococcus sp.]|jgi:Asp-tRNA(Asn)/Glu-tRNA(Gln) amidotransferase A subunit family amidase|nr:Amidase [Blastococcus sp.]